MSFNNIDAINKHYDEQLSRVNQAYGQFETANKSTDGKLADAIMQYLTNSKISPKPDFSSTYPALIQGPVIHLDSTEEKN
jgi:hypothetical protein